MKTLLTAALLCATALPATAAELPSEIAKAGAIKVAIVPNYPPMEFKDPATGQLTGFDVELGEAIGKKLGVTFAWQETSFDQMMPAIATGRVDAIMSGMTDYATRHETATFVDYLRSGPQFFVQKSRAAEFADMSGLCGKNVGASRRTTFPAEIAAWSDANCAGKEPIKFVGTEGSADARTQLKQGRIDAAVIGVGSAGTFTGIARMLKKQLPNILCVAVEPQGSLCEAGDMLTWLMPEMADSGECHCQPGLVGRLDNLVVAD